MGKTFNTGRLGNGLFTDANGNVGIGTTTPSYKLDIQSSSVGAFGSTVTAAWSSGFLNHSYFMAPNMTGGGLSIAFGKSNGTYNVAKIVYNHVADASSSNYIGLGFWDADNRLVVRADGDICIGVTSSIWNSSGRGVVHLNGATNAIYGLTIGGSNAGYLYHTGTTLILNNNLAQPLTLGTDGQERMRIDADGTLKLGTYHSTAKFLPGADSNHYLRYSTAIDGLELSGYSGVMFSTYGGSERMRVTLDGRVCINTTAKINEGRLNIVDDCNQVTPIELKDTASNPGGAYLLRFVNSGGAVCGSIAHQTSTTVQYNTSSDYRLKTDLKNYNGLELVSKIKTYDFEWIEDKNRMYGVLAHELYDVIPYAVNGVKDGKQMQGVDYSKIVPVLVKAIQELKAEIDILKNK